MADVALILCMADYDRTRALIDGSVKPEGVNLTYLVSPPSETFWKMLKFNAYDSSEMSFSSFLIAKSQGRAWTAIPVFPFRAFFHTFIFVRADSNIKEPEDLSGKKFGLPEYQVTAAVWVRGVLQHEYDVSPTSIKWYVERKQELSHGGETGFSPPAGVSVERIPVGETLASLLLSGEIDALMPSPYAGMKSMLNKTDYLELRKDPRVKLLFKDPVEEGIRYYKKNGFSHTNHVLIIQDSLLQKYPWVALSLFRAFEKSKQRCYERLDNILRSSLIFAFAHLESQRRAFGEDAYPYGLRTNKKTLETLANYSVEQGLVNKIPQMAELFHETTLDT